MAKRDTGTQDHAVAHWPTSAGLFHSGTGDTTERSACQWNCTCHIPWEQSPSHTVPSWSCALLPIPADFCHLMQTTSAKINEGSTYQTNWSTPWMMLPVSFSLPILSQLLSASLLGPVPNLRRFWNYTCKQTETTDANIISEYKRWNTESQALKI